MHYFNKYHANKIWGAVALVGALLVFLLVLAEVASTDSYSLAAQAQASGDLALMQLTLNDDAQHDSNQSQFVVEHEHPAGPQ